MNTAFKIETIPLFSMTPPEGGIVKPSIDEVLQYTKSNVRKIISDKASMLPKEQREEIEQEAYFRIIKKYPEIEPEGWKSLVYNHCRGAVLDYIKQGTGFEEDRKSLQNNDIEGASPGKIFDRMSMQNSDNEDLSVDQIVGQQGIFNQFDMDKVEINWELVSRLASQDECLHAFAKSLRGITLDQIAPVFGVKIARAGQMVQAFIDRFDDTEYAACPWFKQCCLALGISELLGLPKIDQSNILGFNIGWNLPPVDIDSIEPCKWIKENNSQMSFVDE